MKPDLTYTIGMRPLLYSVKEAEASGIGRYRDGYNSRKSKHSNSKFYLNLMLVINRDRRDAQRDEQLQCIYYCLNLDLKL